MHFVVLLEVLHSLRFLLINQESDDVYAACQEQACRSRGPSASGGWVAQGCGVALALAGGGGPAADLEDSSDDDAL